MYYITQFKRFSVFLYIFYFVVTKILGLDMYLEYVNINNKRKVKELTFQCRKLF